jgi:hypothetical protein
MGLTIHYGLKSDRTEVESVRSLVRDIRRLATRLPFQAISEVVEFAGPDCAYDHDDDWRWLKIQAGQYARDGDSYFKVAPLHIIAFTINPGEGSEPANLGFARYPDVIESKQLRKRICPNLPGWCWRSFCKTQYASHPAAGGTANFVRCHASLVLLLDSIQNGQLASVEVNDESDYWTHRDVRKLAETVGEWNEMTAAVAGQLKDLECGSVIDAPITKFPDFEHLEARGRDRLDGPQS